MKIVSFNSLYYGFSNHMCSFNDQLQGMMQCVTAESPDVVVFLEAPDRSLPVSSKTLMLHHAIAAFDQWMLDNGYRYTHHTREILSIWIFSKLKLVHLLLMGKATLAEAFSTIFPQIPREQNKIDASSPFPKVIQHMIEKDRSVVLGVVNEKGSAVLPIVVTHAKCRYFNTRFGRLLLHLCRAVVARKGIIFGDMNIDMTEPVLLDGPDFKDELPPPAQSALLSLPQGYLSCDLEEHRKTSNSVEFPFAPLAIDLVVAPRKLQVTSAPGPAVIPNRSHPSDHRWISFDAVDDDMLAVESSDSLDPLN